MDDNKKKPSTYQMLKRLDKQVVNSKSSKKDYIEATYSSERKRYRSRSPKVSTKREESPELVPEKDFDYDIPDRSHGDLYCKACDSHMNSEQMWEAHIQGKRHLKHVHKAEPDLKYVDISIEDPLCLPEIKKSKLVLVGLQHCCELRRQGSKPSYQCFLCSANVPNTQQLLDHVAGMKHRMAYLKEHDPVKHDLISKTELKRGALEPVVEDCVRLHFEKYGHGKMQVKMAKLKPVSHPPAKKYYKDDDHKKKKMERKPSPPRKLSPPREPHFDGYDYRHGKPRDWESPPRSRDSFPDRPYYPPDIYERSHWFRETDHFIEREPPPLYPPRSLTPPGSRRIYEGRPQDPYDQINPSHSRTSDMGRQGDLRTVLDQRKAVEPPAAKANVYESLVTVINSLPNMLFLELMLSRVEKLNPADDELSIIQKIGNLMISLVMDKKLKKLSPDLLNKYNASVGQNPTPEVPAADKMESTNIPNSLKDLISYFKTSQPNNSNNEVQIQQSYEYLQNSPSGNAPTYVSPSTGSFFPSSSSSNSTSIPGLTLSENVENQTSYNSSNLPSHQSAPQGWNYPV